jgi:hypothetical protein
VLAQCSLAAATKPEGNAAPALSPALSRLRERGDREAWGEGASGLGNVGGEAASIPENRAADQIMEFSAYGSLFPKGCSIPVWSARKASGKVAAVTEAARYCWRASCRYPSKS